MIIVPLTDEIGVGADLQDLFIKENPSSQSLHPKLLQVLQLLLHSLHFLS
jgi:hypothetical protein